MVEHMDKMIDVFVNDTLSEFYYKKIKIGWYVRYQAIRFTLLNIVELTFL